MPVFVLRLFGGCNRSKASDEHDAGDGCKDAFSWVGSRVKGLGCVGVMVVLCVEMDVGGGVVGQGWWR